MLCKLSVTESFIPHRLGSQLPFGAEEALLNRLEQSSGWQQALVQLSWARGSPGTATASMAISGVISFHEWLSELFREPRGGL